VLKIHFARTVVPVFCNHCGFPWRWQYFRKIRWIVY